MLKIKLVKSPVSSKPDQRATVKALGLTKLQSEVVKNDNPQIRGMIKKIAHLIEVSEVKEV
ncbi:MAG: 50S ribosomal protein L30 [Bacillales bacterium]|nr:50S ribosomal protein L30 [Bacillales bacterium]